MEILKFNVFNFLNKSKKTTVPLVPLCRTFPVMHDLVGVVTPNMEALPKVCVYLLHNWQAYKACNRHETECLFTAGEHWSKVPVSLCAAQYVISLVSEYHHHPSMQHLSTHQSISLGQKIVHVHRSHLMEQVVYYFLGKKEHQSMINLWLSSELDCLVLGFMRKSKLCVRHTLE